MKFDFSQFCSYNIGKPEKTEKLINYALAGNGAVEIRENEIGSFISKTTKIAGLEEIKEGVTMKVPKIPLELLFNIIGFFKEVNNKFKSEAIIQVYWDRKAKSYFCFCPNQEVAGASCNFKRDTQMDKDYLLVMDIHSHDTMSAFFSGTDNGDEQETRFYGVIGDIEKPWPDMKFRVKSGKSEPIEISLSEVFDIEYDFPKEWMKKVKERKVEVVKYNYKNYQGKDWWNDPKSDKFQSELEKENGRIGRHVQEQLAFDRGGYNDDVPPVPGEGNMCYEEVLDVVKLYLSVEDMEKMAFELLNIKHETIPEGIKEDATGSN